MKETIIYIHGKGGSAKGAEHYKAIFQNHKVIGFDYHSKTPWEARKEFYTFFEKQCSCAKADTESHEQCNKVTLIANSIGAFFAMSAPIERFVSKAYFISPIVDMEKLIINMMKWSNVTESELKKKHEIPTDFGETLSWDYLCYVREHPILWNVPTNILYGEHDNLTSCETVSEFARSHGAKLTVMTGGEHWFHTKSQLQFLDCWLKNEESKT